MLTNYHAGCVCAHVFYRSCRLWRNLDGLFEPCHVAGLVQAEDKDLQNNRQKRLVTYLPTTIEADIVTAVLGCLLCYSNLYAALSTCIRLIHDETGLEFPVLSTLVDARVRSTPFLLQSRCHAGCTECVHFRASSLRTNLKLCDAIARICRCRHTSRR